MDLCAECGLAQLADDDTATSEPRGVEPQALKDQVRALEPWPKTYTYWHRPEGPGLRLILGPLRVVEAPDVAPPGTVLEAQEDRLIVAAGAGAVALSQVQPSGKRALSVPEFLRGYRIRPGDRLGPE